MNRLTAGLLLIIAIVCQSCATWHKASITIGEAVDIGKVKITTGTPTELENAVEIGHVIVKKKGHTKKEYLNLVYYENHYHGMTETSEYELISPDSVLVVMPKKSLKTQRFRRISYADSQYYGKRSSQELLDTLTIHEVYKKGENKHDPNALGVLGAVALVNVALAAVAFALIYLFVYAIGGG